MSLRCLLLAHFVEVQLQELAKCKTSAGKRQENMAINEHTDCTKWQVVLKDPK